MEPGKPNNKFAHGFARYISNMATSYFMGKPVRYVIPDEKFNTLIKDHLKDVYNYNYEISKSASKYGISFELLYVNETSELKSKKYEAQEIIPVYSTKIDEFLECAVHIYQEWDLDGNLLLDGADVYTKSDIWQFTRRDLGALFELQNVVPHFLGDVPVIVYWNNEEQEGDFEAVVSLIDAYDKAQSNTGNDMDYFTDAYLVVEGASGGFVDEEGNDISGADAERTLRQTRIMFLGDNGKASFLTKQDSGTGTESYKDRIFKDIFFISQVPPMTDESFSGNLSGIAIRYKLIGLEQLAIMKENKFRLALKKKLAIITDWINLKNSTSFDASQIEQKYERNFVDNDAEQISNAATAEGIVSHETQLSMMPSSVVPDAKEELKKIEKETKQNDGMFMETEHEDDEPEDGDES
jgi:SPP1 family phage portal protein